MTELAMNAKITRSRLSHAIARLEKNGWVRREDCPSDKRGQFAVLTDEGHEVLRRTAPGHVDAVRQALFDRLSAEQRKTLGEVMDIVARASSRRTRTRTCPGSAERNQGRSWSRTSRGVPTPRDVRSGPKGYELSEEAATGVSGRRPGPSPRPRRPRH